MKHRILQLLLPLVALLIPATGFPADCVNYGAYMHWVGQATTEDEALDVVVSGTTAYVADSIRGLRVFDVTDPKAPRFLGKLQPPGTFRKLAVSGTTVYAAAYNFGLEVLDLSDPAHGSKVGDLILSGYATGIAVSGSLVYVTTVNKGGFKIIDVSDPAAPVEVGSLSLVYAYDVTVVGSLAYVANGTAGLLVVDVANPSRPRIIGRLDTPGTATSVTVSGNLAYVSDLDSGLQIIDVRDPAAPALLSTLVLTSPVHDAATVGSTVFVANYGAGVKAVDVSDPRHPVVVGSVTPYRSWGYVVPTSGCVGITVSGTTAFVAAERKGLQMFDVGNPKSPPAIGTAGPYGRTFSVAVSGSTVCVGDLDQGVHVLRLSPSGAVDLLGSLDTPGKAYDVVVSGSLVFVADGSSGLRILDIANPADPVLIGSAPTEGWARAVAVSGSTAYVAESGEDRLEMFDVSDPRNPSLLSSLALPDDPREIEASGTLVCVAMPFYGVWVFDMSDPSAPEHVSTLDIRVGQTMRVALSGSTACIGDHWTPSVRMYDLADPAHPSYLGGATLSLEPLGIAISGPLVYVADGLAGLMVIDMSDPTAPVTVGNTDPGSFVQGVALAGAGVCVVSYRNLLVHPYQCTEPQVLFATLVAASEPGGIVVEWEPSLEVGVLGFHVERSGDGGRSYETLTRAPILPGQGSYAFLDGGALPGVLYYYRIKVLEHMGGTEWFGPVAATIESEDPGDPGVPTPTLGAAFPNPAAGGGCAIPYRIDRDGPVTLRILDVAGREVRTLLRADMEAGRDYVSFWNGRDARGAPMPAGVYFYRLESPGFTAARRLVWLP